MTMLDFEFAGFFNAFDAQSYFSTTRIWISEATVWIQTKYTEAPALVLGLGFALALPVIAIVGSILRLVSGRQPRLSQIPRTVRTQPASAWRQRASLELTDSNAASFQVGRKPVRIGRETDNDLCLSDPTVHRYHAVLEQTPEAEYILSYVGDPDNDGLFVNGQSVQRLRLRGGEILEIGAIKLRFALSAA